MNNEHVDNLLIDGSNLCHIHFHGNKNADDDTFLSLTFMTALNSIKYLYLKFKPKNIIIVFDNKLSWRKVYTEDIESCVTHVKYKSKRHKNKTAKELERLAILEENIIVLKEMFQKHTSILTLSRKLLEGDDLIAGYIQLYPQEKTIIVSSDKDFYQLITDNVKLYNPVSEKFRTLEDWDDDAKLFIFEKCFRGDDGDSVISSYPRIRRNKIKQAYTDDFTLNNVMNNKFSVEYINHDGDLIMTEYTTKDVFEENKLLMDLTCQPEEIKSLIKKTILEERDANCDVRMSMFNFLKFCNKYQLVNIIKNAQSFMIPFNL